MQKYKFPRLNTQKFFKQDKYSHNGIFKCNFKTIANTPWTLDVNSAYIRGSEMSCMFSKHLMYVQFTFSSRGQFQQIAIQIRRKIY